MLRKRAPELLLTEREVRGLLEEEENSDRSICENRFIFKVFHLLSKSTIVQILCNVYNIRCNLFYMISLSESLIYLKTITAIPGRNQRKISGGAEVTFGNDYDVIEVQSNMMRLFCYDQLTNSDGGTFFIMGAMGVHRREQNGRLPPPWKFGYEPSTSRKPEVNSLIPILIELILAMTVSFLV